MSSIHVNIMKLSSESVLLVKDQQQTNLHGKVTVKNISNNLIAVKVKSNNPKQYIVTPSMAILNPEQKEQFSFIKNGFSISNIQDKVDKFQFIAIQIDDSQVESYNNQRRVDLQLFSSREKYSQKAVLDVQFGSEFSSSEKRGIQALSHISDPSTFRNKKNIQTQIMTRLSNSAKRPTVLPSAISGWQGASTSASELKYGQKSTSSQNGSQLKNPMSPSLQKTSMSMNEKDKEFKLKYERVIQQVHEYEKNFQQLDQEIKMTKNEKEKWNQIQNASKKKTNVSEGYESWHVLLVMLISMFIGVLWAK